MGFSRFILFLVAVFYINGCYYIVSNNITYAEKHHPEFLGKIHYIFIDQFKGRDGPRLKNLLGDSLKEENIFEIIDSVQLKELNEEEREHTAILDTQVLGINFWEVEQIDSSLPQINLKKTSEQNSMNSQPRVEVTESFASSLLSDSSKNDPVVITNLILIFRFKLNRLSDNATLFEKTIEQTFQQYYKGEGEIENRPDAQYESDRLSRLTFARLAASLNYRQNGERLFYEQGVNTGWFGDFLFFSGNETILKGIRLAEARNWRDALLTWLVAAYEPKEDTEQEIFLANRAAAFYNMGQTYSILGYWHEAAQMYAKANQAKKQLHYAQAWSDAILRWKITRENNLETEKIIVYDDGKKERIDGKKIQEIDKKKARLPDFVDNRTLLSKENLWPFERFNDEN